MTDSAAVLTQLMETIVERKRKRPAKSYTTKLLDEGLPTIGKKVLEEAAEVVEAAGELGSPGQDHTVREAADLVYHLLVLLAWRDISLDQVEAELARRFGISGLEEKASRRPS
jgi:phosphoribosyl-ATP pyrophosphohydrolase